MACRTGFDFFNRKHHCRGCGRIFCHSCSSQKSLLPPEFGTRDPQRVCQQCYRDLLPFQKDLIETVSNQMKVNEIEQTGARRYFSSPLTFTLGHAIRNAACEWFSPALALRVGRGVVARAGRERLSPFAHSALLCSAR